MTARCQATAHFPSKTAFRDIYNPCASRNCKHTVDTIQNFQMGKRVLVQVREPLRWEWEHESPMIIRKSGLEKALASTFYYHRYKSTLVVLRAQGGDAVHSSLIIRRSNCVVVNTVAEFLSKIGSSATRGESSIIFHRSLTTALDSSSRSLT